MRRVTTAVLDGRAVLVIVLFTTAVVVATIVELAVPVEALTLVVETPPVGLGAAAPMPRSEKT